MQNDCRVIIDGYNLIFQCGLEGRSRSPMALERARDRLIKSLTLHLSDEQRSRTMVVFDAKDLPIKEVESISYKNGITIVYAVDYDEADSLIEELIIKNSIPKQLTLVSSDHRIHKAARRRRANPIDSDVWFDQLEKGALDSEPGAIDDPDAIDKSIPDGFADVDWTKEFGLEDD